MKPVVTHLFADEVVATLRQTLGKLPRGDGKLPANRAGVSEATVMPAATEAGTKKHNCSHQGYKYQPYE